MKKFQKSNFTLLFAILVLTSISLSCSNDDNSNSTTNNPATIINIVTSGTWKITYYYDNDQDETNNFNGYNFAFNTNNVLTAISGANTYTGSWSVTNSNSNDDSSNDLDFNIAFNSPAEFQELTDDWEIISRSSTEIKLRDISGGNGGTDYLTFSKN